MYFTNVLVFFLSSPLQGCINLLFILMYFLLGLYKFKHLLRISFLLFAFLFSFIVFLLFTLSKFYFRKIQQMLQLQYRYTLILVSSIVFLQLFAVSQVLWILSVLCLHLVHTYRLYRTLESWKAIISCCMG